MSTLAYPTGPAPTTAPPDASASAAPVRWCCWPRSSSRSWPRPARRPRCTRSTRREWGFSPITTTVVFGVYARRGAGSRCSSSAGSPTTSAAGRCCSPRSLVQAAAMVVFAFADGVPELLIARVVQGLATGAARRRARRRDARRRPRAGRRGQRRRARHRHRRPARWSRRCVVQFLPAPTHLIYLALLAVFALQAVGVALMPETVTPRAGRCTRSSRRSRCRAAYAARCSSPPRCCSRSGRWPGSTPRSARRWSAASPARLGGLRRARPVRPRRRRRRLGVRPARRTTPARTDAGRASSG